MTRDPLQEHENYVTSHKKNHARSCHLRRAFLNRYKDFHNFQIALRPPSSVLGCHSAGATP